MSSELLEGERVEKKEDEEGKVKRDPAKDGEAGAKMSNFFVSTSQCEMTEETDTAVRSVFSHMARPLTIS